MYWRSMAAIAIVGVALSLALALTTKRVWRSEATLLYRDVIQTGQQAGGGARAARLGPKLKDMVFARAKLASVIEEHGLYPEKTSRSMVEAVTEMQSHLGFRARDSDSYVISFSHHDPVTAQRVAGRLADLIIEEYRRENLTAATMTRDFLRRELAQATARVDEASRALATFLAKNPQFQWGLGDSPYAPVPQAAAGAQPAPARPLPAAPPRSVDPELAALERRLAQVEAKLSPPQPAPAPGDAPLPDSVADAQKARDAAAASLAAAAAALADKLRVVTPLHPDATAAQGRVDAARRELAAAESALRMVRGGVRPPPSGEPELGALGAADRAALEKERSSLFRQIAARRSRLMAERQGAPRTGTGTGTGAGTGTGTRAATPEEQAVNDVVELETEWHRLRLDLDRARDALKTVQANERAASLSAEAAERKGDTEMAILDPAYLPARPDKGRGRVFFAGVAMSLMLAFGLAGARVLLNDTLYDEADVDALGGPPVLAAMPPIPEPQAPRARTMVPLTTVPPAANSPGGEPDDAPESDDEVDQRLHAVTLRWGSPLDPDEVIIARPAAAPIVRVAVAPLARTRPPIDPDVEEIGDDPADDGHGAIELLRQAPPAAQAALRVLRHRLEQRRGDEHMVVSVVSPGQAEGKTTVAARLAMTLAEAERARVILVEGNLTRPRVATTLGLKLPDYAGLSHQIRQRMLGKASTPGAPGQARAHVAPGAAPGQAGLPQRPLGVVRIAPSLWVLAEPALGATYPDVVNSPYFGAALQSLRRCFDYVIIDGPAVLGSGDANILEDAADGIVLVARASMTRGSSLTRAMAQLGDRRILGVVLNDVSERPVARKKIVTAPGQEDAVV